MIHCVRTETGRKCVRIVLLWTLARLAQSSGGTVCASRCCRCGGLFSSSERIPFAGMPSIYSMLYTAVPASTAALHIHTHTHAAPRASSASQHLRPASSDRSIPFWLAPFRSDQNQRLHQRPALSVQRAVLLNFAERARQPSNCK